MNVATNAIVATISRSKAPTISYHSRRPLNATTPNADAMNSLSATGSMTGPNLELPNRRASWPVEQVGSGRRDEHHEPPRVGHERKGHGQRNPERAQEIGDGQRRPALLPSQARANFGHLSRYSGPLPPPHLASAPTCPFQPSIIRHWSSTRCPVPCSPTRVRCRRSSSPRPARWACRRSDHRLSGKDRERIVVAMLCREGHIVIHASAREGLCFVDIAARAPADAGRGMEVIARRLSAG